MTKTRFTASLASMVLGSALAAPISAETAVSVDEKTIRLLEEREVAAVLNQDVPALERQISEHYIVNNPQNGITTSREGMLDRVRRGLIRYSSFERRIEAIRIDGDIAIVMGLEIVMPIGAAPRAGQTVHRRFTNIWKRSGTTWVAIARHANVIVDEGAAR